MRCAVVGAGVCGRVLGIKLLKQGHSVEFFDPSSVNGEGSAGYHAGGMLAPYSELESSESLIFSMGILGGNQWAQISADLNKAIGFRFQGSLIVSHQRDQALWHEISQKICSKVNAEEYHLGPATDIEVELKDHFSSSLFLPHEGQVDPRLFFKESFKFSIEHGAIWHHTLLPFLNSSEMRRTFQSFDWVFDTRGIGARKDQRYLRGVRGEALLVKAPEVSITRPVRVMHPRYSLYIVPRQKDLYYLGATQIERDDTSPITVRSALELLSAAYSVHSGFGEGQVVEACVGIRPAYLNNCPQVQVKDKLIRINGLYRHGFLLSPVIADTVLAFIGGKTSIPFVKDIFRGNL